MSRVAQLVTILACIAAGSVCAQTAPAAGRLMTSTGPATPPLGFAEFCQRVPLECTTASAPSPDDLDEVRDWASRSVWAAVFGSGPAINAVQPSSIDSPAYEASSETLSDFTSARAARIDRDEAAVAGLADPSLLHPDLSDFAVSVPIVGSASVVLEAARAPQGAKVILADIQNQALGRLNRRINREIRNSSDMRTFGMADYWANPLQGGRTGDCEDYVLAKRRALIDGGVHPAALSIAIVETRQGEAHAVLLIQTAAGEMVLDNLTSRVLPWHDTPYTWVMRQEAGFPLNWIALPPRG